MGFGRVRNVITNSRSGCLTTIVRLMWKYYLFLSRPTLRLAGVRASHQPPTSLLNLTSLRAATFRLRRRPAFLTPLCSVQSSGTGSTVVLHSVRSVFTERFHASTFQCFARVVSKGIRMRTRLTARAYVTIFCIISFSYFCVTWYRIHE